MFDFYEPSECFRVPGPVETRELQYSELCINCSGSGEDGYGDPCRTCEGLGTQRDYAAIEDEEREARRYYRVR